jgi:hypothetical protein
MEQLQIMCQPKSSLIHHCVIFIQFSAARVKILISQFFSVLVV